MLAFHKHSIISLVTLAIDLAENSVTVSHLISERKLNLGEKRRCLTNVEGKRFEFPTVFSDVMGFFPTDWLHSP